MNCALFKASSLILFVCLFCAPYDAVASVSPLCSSSVNSNFRAPEITLYQKVYYLGSKYAPVEASVVSVLPTGSYKLRLLRSGHILEASRADIASYFHGEIQNLTMFQEALYGERLARIVAVQADGKFLVSEVASNTLIAGIDSSLLIIGAKEFDGISVGENYNFIYHAIGRLIKVSVVGILNGKFTVAINNDKFSNPSRNLVPWDIADPKPLVYLYGIGREDLVPIK